MPAQATAAMRRERGDVVTLVDDLSGCRIVDSHQRLAEGGLAAAALADDAEDLALAHREAHAVQRAQPAYAPLPGVANGEVPRQLLDFENAGRSRVLRFDAVATSRCLVRRCRRGRRRDGVVVAAHLMLRRDLLGGRPALAACLARILAARVKPAAGRRIDQSRDLTSNTANAVLPAWQALQQALRIGVRRTGEEARARCGLHLLSGVHHDHAITDLVCGTEIVRGEDHGNATLGGEVAQQLENLRLNGDIQRVVGSSAMIRRGSGNNAIAIIRRWRCPPLTWWGYLARISSGWGSCTSLMSSTIRARSARRRARGWRWMKPRHP